MAARVSSTPVRTFTISFPGHGALRRGGHARQVAEHFGTEHTELVAEPATVDDCCPQLARQYDEPMADSSMVPRYLVSRADPTARHGGARRRRRRRAVRRLPALPAGSWRRSGPRRVVPGPAPAVRGARGARCCRRACAGRNHLIGFAAGPDREHRPRQPLLRLPRPPARCSPRRRPTRLAGRRAGGLPGRPGAARSTPRSGRRPTADFRTTSGRRHPRQGRPRQHAHLAGGARAVARPPAGRVRLRPGARPAAGDGRRSGRSCRAGWPRACCRRRST